MNFASRDVSGDFPDSEKIYLNSASASIMPSRSIDAMREFLISYGSVGPDSTESLSLVTDKIHGAKQAISQIISCRPEEVVFTKSTTEGINIVADRLLFGAGSNMIMRQMLHEHQSNMRPWLGLGDRTEIRRLPVDQNGFFDPGDIEPMLDRHTGLVTLSHALYNIGSILSVQEAGRIIRGRAPFLVDGAQTVGCLDDVDVSRIGCDFMSFNGSKWLCGPPGIGVFYCSRDSRHLLEHATVGRTSASHYDETDPAFGELSDRFQTGFRNHAGMVGLESSARYLQKFGMDNVRKKNQSLSTLLRDELARIPNVTLYGPSSEAERTSIVSFNISGIDPRDVVTRLEKQNIILAVRGVMNAGAVRASPHFFNTESQILEVADALRML